MVNPASSRASDRHGSALPESPSVEDVERAADALRIVDEADLSPGATDRVSPEELEQRRLRTLGR